MTITPTMPSMLDLRIDRGLADLRRPAVRRALVDAMTSATDDLNSGRIDVLVLAARRMLCLYSALRDLGLPAPERGTVVSDRFLEVLPDGAWRDLNVLLIDDTTITGVTLDGRRQTLERLVVGSGSFETSVVLDPPGWAITPAQKQDWLHDETDGDLHSQTAAVFGRTLTPYFTDFAISTTVERPTADLYELLTLDGWQIAEVTNVALAGTGSRSFSMFPGPAVRAAIDERLGEAAIAVDVVKVRVLSRQTGDQVAIRVVPIVLIQEFRRNAIERLLEGIRGEGADDLACEQLAGILTYDLSRTLFDVVVTSIEPAIGPVHEDAGHRALVLGSLADRLGTPWPWVDLVAPDRPTPERSVLIDGGGGVVVGDDSVQNLLQQFEQMADGEPGATERERWTLQELAVQRRQSTADLSLALDIGNDLGTVVPSHLVTEDRVRRAYRPGESNDRIRARRHGGSRWASVPTTIRLDERLRPVSWSESREPEV